MAQDELTSLEARRRKLQAYAEKLGKKYGNAKVGMGSDPTPWKALPPIPTGILSLDYALGRGGWPRGCLVGVYGPRDIGKSSTLGFQAIKSAQAMGLNCGVVAVEPGFDGDWGDAHGIDSSSVVVSRVQGRAAFDMFYDFANDDVIDFILFDSIGALLTDAEIDGTGSTDAKAKVGGQSGLITWGIKRVSMPIYLNGKTALVLNQVRDVMGAHVPMRAQGGGHALEHMENVIIELKRGKKKWTLPLGNGDEYEVGTEVVAVVRRNKTAEGTKKTAKFNFFNTHTEEYPFGVDTLNDIVATGLLSGAIIKAGSWYTLPDGEKRQGTDWIPDYLEENPGVYMDIRNKVLSAVNLKDDDELLEEIDNYLNDELDG
jgi:recombination protein RecA